MSNPVCKCGKSIDDYIDSMEILNTDGTTEIIKTDPKSMKAQGFDKCVDCRIGMVNKVTDKIAKLLGIDLSEDGW